MAHTRERRWFPSSVRGLLLLLICVLVVPVLLVQVWLYRQQYRVRAQAELQANLEMARAVTASFGAFVDDVHQEQLAIGQTMLVLASPGGHQAQQYLAVAQGVHPELRSVSWLSAAGRVLVSSEPELVGQDWSTRPWLRGVRAGRDWVLTDVSRPPRMREGSFEVASPIRGPGGALGGIVVAVVDPNRLDHVVNIVRSGSAAVSLQDSSGWLVFRRPAMEPPYAERDWGKLYPRTVARALAGHEAKAIEYSSYQKGRRIIGSAPVAGTGWAGSAGRPEPEAMAPIRAEIAKSAVLLMVVALAGLVLALAVAQAIAAPLRVLRQHALAFGRGELARRAPARGPSDLAEVSGAFNQMADDLQRRQREQERGQEALRESEARLAREAAGLVRLNEAGSRLWRVQSLPEGLDEILAATIELLGADKGNVQLLDADRCALHIVAQRGFGPDFLSFFREVAAEDDTACGRALRSGQRVIIEDVEADEAFTPFRAIARAAEYRAVQSTPLIGRDGVPLGMLSTHFRSPHRPSTEDLRRLDLYVHRAADFIAWYQAEEALRESERDERERAEELAALLDAIPTPVIIVHDPDGMHMTGNRAADELLRQPSGAEASLSAPAEARPRHFRALKDGRELRTDELPAQRAARGAQVQDFEFSLVFDDGTTREVVGYGTPLRDAEGKPRGAVHVLVDVTERRRAQEQLLEAARTRARMAQTLADEIAHRTKNNLAIVAALLQTQLDHQAQRPLDPGLVQDAISRIHTFVVLHEQMYQTQGEEVELVSALRQVAELDRQALAAQRATISVEGEPARYPSGVGTNLCVVANELVTNALKHAASAPGGREVQIRVWKEAGRLHLSVWNSGSPIAPDFDLAREAKTGLDLVHTIVEEEYGGTLRLTPERGGTKAEIVLEDARLHKES